MKDVVHFDFEIGKMMSDRLPKSKVSGYFERNTKLIALPNVKVIYHVGEKKNQELSVEYTYDFLTETVHAFCYDEADRYPIFECDYMAEETVEKETGTVIYLNIKNKRFNGQKERDWFNMTAGGGGDITNGEALYENWVVLNNYICYYGIENSFDVEEKVAKRQQKKKSKSKKKNNSVRLYKCYTLKKDWMQAPRLRKPVKYTCPAWGVRGHMRHCPSGKIVYVRPSIKGKERDKYVGKEYLLVPKEKAEVS